MSAEFERDDVRRDLWYIAAHEEECHPVRVAGRCLRRRQQARGHDE